MSFTFTIPTTRFPAPSAILDEVGREGLVWMEDEPEGDAWPEGSVHVGEERGAARGVEITKEDAGMGVRVLACSSLVDFLLALRFVEVFARACGGRVEPEGEEEALPVDLLRSRYGDAWYASETASGTGALRALVERDGSVITVPGFRRDVHVGPKTIARLPTPSAETVRGEALVEVVRRIQWIDEKRWYPARVFQVSGQRGANPRTVAAWGEGVASLFPAVDALVLTAEPVVEVPAAEVEAVAGDLFVEWLDDRQALVEAAKGDAWRALVERARARTASPPPARRPWWKFWGPR